MKFTGHLSASLERSWLFQDLPRERIEQIAARADSRKFAAGARVFAEGSRGAELFVLVSGALVVSRGEVQLATLGPGDVVGEFQVMVPGRRTASVKAVEESRLLALSADVLLEWPDLVKRVAGVVHRRAIDLRKTSVLQSFFGEAPALLEELRSISVIRDLPHGQRLQRSGTEVESWHLVLDGRLLLASEDADGVHSLERTVGRGQSTGEPGLLTGEKRRFTVYASSESTLIEVPVDAMRSTLERYPKALMAVSTDLLTHEEQTDETRLQFAVLPLQDDAPVSSIAEALATQMGRYGTTLHANEETLAEQGIQGMSEQDPEALRHRLGIWLAEQHEKHDFVVLSASSVTGAWATEIARHADNVLLVANADREPDTRRFNELLRLNPWQRSELSLMIENGRFAGMTVETGSAFHLARRTLLLVHPKNRKRPTETWKWFTATNVDAHLHLREGVSEDIGRVARLLIGRAYALVLGGGGARGLAHIGVFRAMRKLGLPVDAVGGTSAGSIISSLIAQGLTPKEMYELNVEVNRRNAFRSFTMPVVSLLQSDSIDGIAKFAGNDADIEDMWLPYFAVSTDLTNAKQVVHNKGPAWVATRASGSLPGIILPVIDRNRLLVDGGVVNNLPVDVMRRRFGRRSTVIAVDVGASSDLSMQRDAFPSQSAMALRMALGRGEQYSDIPTMPNILLRCMVLSGAPALEANTQSADLLIRPPVEPFGMLEFERINELVEVGYQEGLRALQAWSPRHRLPARTRVELERKAEPLPQIAHGGSETNALGCILATVTLGMLALSAVVAVPLAILLVYLGLSAQAF